jgi:hypothetical protein
MKSAAANQPSLPDRAAQMLVRLKGVRGLSDAEKSVHALGLAATPQERWDLFESHVRSFGFWKPSKRRKSATNVRIHGHDVPVLRLERILKCKEVIGRDKDKLHVLLIKDFLRCRREITRKRRRRRPPHR